MIINLNVTTRLCNFQDYLLFNLSSIIWTKRSTQRWRASWEAYIPTNSSCCLENKNIAYLLLFMQTIMKWLTFFLTKVIKKLEEVHLAMSLKKISPQLRNNNRNQVLQKSVSIWIQAQVEMRHRSNTAYV